MRPEPHASEHRASSRAKGLPPDIEHILAHIEHRLDWLATNNIPHDLPSMVRRLADHAREKRR